MKHVIEFKLSFDNHAAVTLPVSDIVYGNSLQNLQMASAGIITKIALFSGVCDFRWNKIFLGDKIKDTLTQAEYIVAYGFCRSHGFTGWYCIPTNHDGKESPLNNDDGENYNSQIKLL